MDGCQTWQPYKSLFYDPAPETPCSHAILDKETASTNTIMDDMAMAILLAYGKMAMYVLCSTKGSFADSRTSHLRLAKSRRCKITASEVQPF